MNAHCVISEIEAFIFAVASAAEDLAAKPIVQVNGFSSAGSRRELVNAVRVSVERDEAANVHICWRCIPPSIQEACVLHALKQTLQRVLASDETMIFIEENFTEPSLPHIDFFSP